MAHGLFDIPIWGLILYTLIVTHITIAGVTIFLHRCEAHRALDLHPAVRHFFRFWLWITTGIEAKQWVAVHRKHHARVETDDDPHSPQILGIGKLLLEGREIYVGAFQDQETIDKYGHGTPDDWLERTLYTRFSGHGYYCLLVLNTLLFGPIGITIFAVQMLWIPICAAGVINGIGHFWGYRNYETADASTNIVPWGIIIGGEELHNNHHAFASSAKLSSKPWEFDIGWAYIRILEGLGLARVKKVSPKPVLIPGKDLLDIDAVRAIVSNRFQVMSRYAKSVLAQVHKEELRNLNGSQRSLLKRAKSLLIREESRLNEASKQRLEDALNFSQTLRTTYQYKQRLQELWHERHASHERLLEALQEWCHQAEASGIRALQEFARTLPTYSMQPA